MNYLKILSILLVSFLMITNVQAQEIDYTKKYEFLKGLKKACEGDIDPNQQIQLDGNSIPIYNLEGERLSGMELMESFMSGDYSPELYIDDKKDIKAVLLRKATEEEKRQMKEMNAQ